MLTVLTRATAGWHGSAKGNAWIVVAGLLAVGPLVGCSAATPAAPLAPTVDPILYRCQQDVEIANRDPHDITLLDFAIHDCGTVAMLEQVVASRPGYLTAAVTVRTFAANRCAAASVLSGVPICAELGVKF